MIIPTYFVFTFLFFFFFSISCIFFFFQDLRRIQEGGVVEETHKQLSNYLYIN